MRRAAERRTDEVAETRIAAAVERGIDDAANRETGDGAGEKVE